MHADRFAAHIRRSRIALYSFLPFAALAAASSGLMGTFQSGLRLLYILLGFSLIIFLHELGHFVVARLCSVKCLAFSIGIGPRMCGWCKNGKFTFGGDPYDPESKKHKHVATETAAVQSDLPTAATVPPHPQSVGDCDYRVSWLPLGGYVRMLGQDDMDPSKVSADPHAFNQRPIWQRMCIVSAGVIMNVIFAAVCFSIIFSPGIGVDFPPAKVGPVTYGMPAWEKGKPPEEAKLRMGDQIISINGEKPRGFVEFTDVMMAAALAHRGEVIRLEVIRYDSGKKEFVDLVPTESAASGFLAFGFEQMPGLKIGGTAEEYTNADAEKSYGHRNAYKANKSELQDKLKDAGWKIVGVDDIDLRDQPQPNASHDKYVTLYKHVNKLNGKPVKLALENLKTGDRQDMTLHPYLEWIPGAGMYPPVLGLSPQVFVADVQAGNPADRAGLKTGDRILRIGDRTGPSLEQTLSIIRASGGESLSIKVERPRTAATGPAVSEETTINVAAKKVKSGVYQIGITPFQDLATTRFAVAAEGAKVDELDLGPHSTIVAIDGRPVADWQEIYSALRTVEPQTPVKVSFKKSPEAQPFDHTFTLSQADSDLVRYQLQFMLGLHLENETRTQKADNAWSAFLMGMDHTKKFILNVYMTLGGLFRGTVDATNLHGIVGITKVGYDVQERGPVWLWYILAMVSVNLAVANFLPLPIVDGGLFLLLILEKIRGKPLPLKVQTAIQTVGIVLLAGLFLFVTVNDINLFR